MNTLTYKGRYRRRLPHIQPPGASFFITFRLTDSIPQKAWKELRARMAIIREEFAHAQEEKRLSALERERLWFQEFEEHLHGSNDGQFWLEDERLAALVAKEIHYFDGKRYRLDAFCVMFNHVHTVLLPLPTTEVGRTACLNHKLVEDRDRNLGYIAADTQQFVPVTFYSLASIMHSIKRHTAREANQLLGRTGAFWQDESYDHYNRDHDEWLRCIRYTLNNPVKAGLVKEWQNWPWNWCRQGM